MPRRGHRWLIGAASVIAMTLLGCGASTGPAHHASTLPREGWGAPDADRANTRHVTGPIDARSVSKLRLAWSVPLKGLYAATPIVVGGTAYTADLLSNVYAIDVTSGRLRWTRTYNQPDTGPNGVNVADGRVYGVLPSSAFALDAKTGRELWRTPLVRNTSELIVMTPGEQGGTVYVSTVPGGGGRAVGTLSALDGATGKRRWQWHEVPPSLWGHPEINGGGGLWHPPAFDEHGALYISIANPTPFPGAPGMPWGASRPGPNRWDNSIVKLDARTGTFLWGTQVLPHDIYDWDLECPVILANAHGRRLALTAGKMGFVYAFDAATGAVVWKRSVGIHNGHDHDNLFAMAGRYERLRLNQRLLPGGWGGVETPMASDGTTVYVPVNNFAGIYRAQHLAPPDQADPITGRGEFVALDIATGRVRWDRRLPHSPYGGATVSDDVVFTTTYDGTAWGFDTHSGKTVWRSRLPTGTDAPVAVAGDTLITAGSIPLDTRQRPAIVAYRLGG